MKMSILQYRICSVLVLAMFAAACKPMVTAPIEAASAPPSSTRTTGLENAEKAQQDGVSTSQPVAEALQDANVQQRRTSNKRVGQNAKPLIKRCGRAQMELQCVSLDASCTQTSLILKNATGDSIEIAKPKELSEYTAAGLGCATDRDKTSYFVVQYGELPYGCAFCEWFYLYSIQGQQLTRSAPPVLTDNTLPAGNRQMPNNLEFDEMSDKLGLDEPHMEFMDL